VSYRIALVDDEADLANLLQSYLLAEGYDVDVFTDGLAAAAALDLGYDLWILDIMLPGLDGYGLLRKIRERNAALPVIFISARDADIDRVVGLELGSDDYVAKPFLPRELVVRVKRLLQRTYGQSPERDAQTVLVGDYVVELEDRRVKVSGGEEVELTTKEFDLLVFFAQHLNQQISREQILDGVWGEDYFGNDRAVDDLVRRLRRRMPGLRLETIYGYGYRLVKQ